MIERLAVSCLQTSLTYCADSPPRIPKKRCPSKTSLDELSSSLKSDASKSRQSLVSNVDLTPIHAH